MTPPEPVRARRWAWELHALVVLFLLVFGGTLRDDFVDLSIPMWGVGGIAVCLIGMFRGRLVAWGMLLVAFGFLVVASGIGAWQLISQFGFRNHPTLHRAELFFGLTVAVVGLLLSSRLRKAFPSPAGPLWVEHPGLSRFVGVIAPLIFLVGALASLSIVVLFSARRYSGERSVSTGLKTICSAEADFRANDRDWNHKNDFWTRDLQGLYGVIPATGTKDSIKLIELSVAVADGNPAAGLYPPIGGDAHAYRGAWYGALIQDRTTTPPVPYGNNPAPDGIQGGFGFIAYPDDYIDGLRSAFIVNEGNTVFRRRLDDDIRGSSKTPPGPLRLPDYADWPSESELKARWSTLD